MTKHDPVDHDTRRRGIQSVEIGLRVLMAVAGQPGPATLSAIAEAAGLSASQTHRYLASLIATAMVRQEGRSGLYDLDAGAIRLGLAGLARLDLFRTVDERLPDFVRRSGRTCLVAVFGDAGPTLVRWFSGSPPVITSLAIGSVLPLLHSATGRVFLTYGEGPVMDGRIAALPAASRPKPAEIAALRAQVARDLCATIDGNLIPGLRAVAAPVFDLQGRLALVVTALASDAHARDGDTAARADLLATCRALTETIGGVWPAHEKPRASRSPRAVKGEADA